MSLENEVRELTAAVRSLNDNLHHFLAGVSTGAGEGPEIDTSVSIPESETLEMAPRETEAANDEPAPEKPKKKAKGQKRDPATRRAEVISALRGLQEAKGAQAVKSLLAGYDAKTLGQLDEGDYEEVIAKAQEEAA